FGIHNRLRHKFLSSDYLTQSSPILWKETTIILSLRSFVTESFHQRLERWQIRFEIFLIIAPTSDSAFGDGLADIAISWRADDFILSVFLKLQNAVVPRRFKKFQRPSGNSFQIFHQIFVTHFEKRVGHD